MSILVIGESCNDIFHYGVCNRLCPEAPVPVFNSCKVVNNGGMAMNVKNNFTALGVDVDIPEYDEVASGLLSYLSGRTMGQLLRVERAATAEALRREGRPNATFHMPRVGASELGQLLMLLQIVV